MVFPCLNFMEIQMSNDYLSVQNDWTSGWFRSNCIFLNYCSHNTLIWFFWGQTSEGVWAHLQGKNTNSCIVFFDIEQLRVKKSKSFKIFVRVAIGQAGLWFIQNNNIYINYCVWRVYWHTMCHVEFCSSIVEGSRLVKNNNSFRGGNDVQLPPLRENPRIQFVTNPTWFFDALIVLEHLHQCSECHSG